MKYMVLMYSSQKEHDLMAGVSEEGPALTPEDFAPMHAFMQAFTEDLMASGEFVDAQSLDAPVHTRRVQVRNGVPVVTDGPYAETEEVIAGYWIVDCQSFDRATEIAARLSGCPSPGDVFADSYADVRPVAGSVEGMES